MKRPPIKRQRRWVAGAVLLLIAAPFAWAAWALLSAENRFEARNEAALVGSDFVGALAAHNYDKAYAMITLSQRQTLSISTIQKVEERAEERYGKPTHRAAIDEYAVGKNLRSARFLYDDTYQHKEDLFLVALVYTDGRWQVSKY